MAYSDTLLAKNERKLYEAHQHWFILIRHGFRWILSALGMVILIVVVMLKTTTTDGNPDGKLSIPFQGWLLLVLLVLALVFIGLFVVEYLRWINHEYIVTNMHVIRVEGVINKTRDDARLDHINDTDMSQTLFGRMLGFGDIRVMTGNDEEQNDIYYMIEHPVQFKRAIDDAISENERNKRGINAQEMQEMMARQQPQFVQPQSQPQFAPQAQFPSQPYAPQPQAQQPFYVQADPYAAGNAAPYVAGPDERTSVGGFPAPRRSTPRSVNNPQDIPTLIKKLADLRDAGVITEQDFQQKKNELMGRM